MVTRTIGRPVTTWSGAFAGRSARHRADEIARIARHTIVKARAPSIGVVYPGRTTATALSRGDEEQKAHGANVKPRKPRNHETTKCSPAKYLFRVFVFSCFRDESY